ncbi:hypothetical protein LguiA_003767 [Lonicera macranthoides]
MSATTRSIQVAGPIVSLFRWSELESIDMIELVNGFGMHQGTNMRFDEVYMAYVVSNLHLEHVVHVCIIIVSTRHLEDILTSSEPPYDIWYSGIQREQWTQRDRGRISSSDTDSFLSCTCSFEKPRLARSINSKSLWSNKFREANMSKIPFLSAIFHETRRKHNPVASSS